jgi:hypothetical protein
MTCAGILALAISYGLPGDAKRPRDPDKDRQLAAALAALGTCVGGPKPDVAQEDDKFYYFVWSVERVCVILDRPKLGRTDWYNWGAELLVNSQGRDGLWRGEFATSGADTCFALLFLKRANLARDLTARIRGKRGDRVLRAGGPKDLDKQPGGEPGTEKPRVAEAKKPAPLGDGPSEKMAKELLAASEGERPALLRKFRDSRGPGFTEALALACSRLEGDAQAKAREALAARLARMKASTLVEYLKDEDGEIRRGAALACGMKRLTDQVPTLVRLLRDPQDPVTEAAHAALKYLTGESFPNKPEPWEEWLKKRG